MMRGVGVAPVTPAEFVVFRIRFQLHGLSDFSRRAVMIS